MIDLPTKVADDKNAWDPLVSGDSQLFERITDVVLTVAERLKSVEATSLAAADAGSAFRENGLDYIWRPTSLASGHLSFALLFGQMARGLSGSGDWDHAADAHLKRAAQLMSAEPVVSPGLFSGLAGLGFVTSYLSANGTRYQKLLASVDRTLGEIIPDLLEEAASDRPLRSSVFDLVSGLTGVAVHLRSRGSSGVGRYLPAVVDALVAKCVTLKDRLGFHIESAQMSPGLQAFAPQGGVDTGLAHGIGSPLSILSLLHLDGVAETETMLHGASLLRNWYLERSSSVHSYWTWPVVVGPGTSQVLGSRLAWCYGSPGISLALWHLGKATKDPALIVASANTVLEACGSDRRDLDGGMICHGTAGLLQIVLRVRSGTVDLALRERATEVGLKLVSETLNTFNEGSPFGFVRKNRTELSDPGFLEGSSGIALVLLASISPAKPDWDRVLLMS